MTNNFIFTAEIAKTSEARRQVAGIIYRANAIDSQNDFVKPETLEKIAHGALAAGVVIDIDHDGRDSGARLVESYIQDDAWIGTVQLTSDLWPLAKSGELRAFSIGGTGAKAETVFKGRRANEITAATVTHVSLVKRGATGEMFIMKSADQLVQQVRQLAETIARNQQVIDALSGGDPEIRKQAENEIIAKRSEDIQRLVRKLSVLNSRLETLWYQPEAGGDGVARERRLLDEIRTVEDELESLRPVQKSVIDDPSRSAFAFRGGSSGYIDAAPAQSWSEILLGKRRTNAMRKSEDEIDLGPDIKI
ncbi:MAG TPA: XkdF-like putative serine protease domain-containing protein [Gammaproteobacteria bacterium]|nr:XkdF-like putative serine protease domain-containing protein [Gammaproteobacteria bacterium]